MAGSWSGYIFFTPTITIAYKYESSLQQKLHKTISKQWKVDMAAILFNHPYPPPPTFPTKDAMWGSCQCGGKFKY